MDTPASAPDRRKQGRTTEDRRDRLTRLEGVWTEAERCRRVSEFREEHHDSRAITVRATRLTTT
jgi:hypothetical protein